MIIADYSQALTGCQDETKHMDGCRPSCYAIAPALPHASPASANYFGELVEGTHVLMALNHQLTPGSGAVFCGCDVGQTSHLDGSDRSRSQAHRSMVQQAVSREWRPHRLYFRQDPVYETGAAGMRDPAEGNGH